eukprot:789538-Rhodomonas_salina.1
MMRVHGRGGGHHPGQFTLRAQRLGSTEGATAHRLRRRESFWKCHVLCLCDNDHDAHADRGVVFRFQFAPSVLACCTRTGEFCAAAEARPSSSILIPDCRTCMRDLWPP